MKKSDSNILVRDLLDTYHELGECSFKIILNPKLFKNAHDIKVEMTDAENNKMPVEIRYWGRKINCTFHLTTSTPNGVNVTNISAVTDKGKTVKKKLHYWVIK